MIEKSKTMLAVVGVVTAIAIIGTALFSLNNSALTTQVPVSNPACLPIQDMKSIMPTLKIPQRLPTGYEYKCGAGNSFEVNTLYSNSIVDKAAFAENIEDFVREHKGAILVRMAIDPQVTNGTAAVIRDYNSILEGNPGLKPQLLDINGKLAWGHEIALNGGKQTATWADGTQLTNTFDMPARLRIYEEGTIIRLEGYVPLQELVDIAKSLQ
jgi:hypothetical protein